MSQVIVGVVGAVVKVVGGLNISDTLVLEVELVLVECSSVDKLAVIGRY